MLITTHEMGFARDVAHRVCFLDEGVLLEEGPPEQIFGTPRGPRTRSFSSGSSTRGDYELRRWRPRRRIVKGVIEESAA